MADGLWVTMNFFHASQQVTYNNKKITENQKKRTFDE